MDAVAWTTDELMTELRRFEGEARAAGLSENTVKTYTDRAERFIRWLSGDYSFSGPNT